MTSGKSCDNVDWASAVVPLRSLARRPVGWVREAAGNKALNLARLLEAGVRVPDGLVITCDAFDAFAATHGVAAVLADCKLAPGRIEGFSAAEKLVASKLSEAAVPEGLIRPLSLQLGALELNSTETDKNRTSARRTWIVRSSAVGEDSPHHSFAGQLDSVLRVSGERELLQAVVTCWKSYWSLRSLFYQASQGARLQGMGVIVQPMLEASMGGVYFTKTRLPEAASRESDDEGLIEYVVGHPEHLVSGRDTPSRIQFLHSEPPPQAPFTQLIDQGRVAEQTLGGAQDIEWLVDEAKQLWIVQSRPVTSSVDTTHVHTGNAGASGLDSRDTREQQVFSNVNVNENYPRPLSPLLYSIVTDAYHRYFRTLGELLGVQEPELAKLDPHLRHAVGVHRGHLYYNLTNIHRCIRVAPLPSSVRAAFDGFVGIDEEAVTSSEAATDEAQALPWLPATETFAGLRGLASLTQTSLQLRQRVERFEKTAAAYKAATTHPERLAVGPLHELFQRFLQVRFFHWRDAASADLAACLAYGALKQCLVRALGQELASRLSPQLLLAIPDVVSVGPVSSLWDLSRVVLRYPVVGTALDELEPAEVIRRIRERTVPAEFCDAFEAHVTTWGHRVAAELMLTTRSYVEDPSSLIAALRAYVASPGPSPSDVLATQQQRRDQTLAETRRALPKRYRLPFEAAFKATQAGIRYRERVRLAQALLYCQFRQVVTELGKRLAALGRLKRADDVLYLSWRELDGWLSGHEMHPHHITDLVELRRVAHEQETAAGGDAPAPSVKLEVGQYTRQASVTAACDDAGPWHGVGIASGTVNARACVLTDIADYARFQAGDCLVTRQTDPGWAPLFFLASSLVLERGGMLCHGAIVAREFGIPAVGAVRHATQVIADGQLLRVDGTAGTVTRVE